MLKQRRPSLVREGHFIKFSVISIYLLYVMYRKIHREKFYVYV